MIPNQIVVPFLVESTLLLYSENEMSLSMGDLQSRLRLKNLTENYTAIGVGLSTILGILTILFAERFSDMLGWEEKTHEKDEAKLQEEKQKLMVELSTTDINFIEDDDNESLEQNPL